MKSQIKYRSSIKKSHAPRKKKAVKKPKVMHWTKRQAAIAARRAPRNFNFEIDWPRVEVTDKTLERISGYMGLDEDEAFDRALEILEHHDDFRVDARWIYREYLKKRFRGNWIHLQWHTYENLQIGIENNRWTRIIYSDRHAYFPDEVQQYVYAAEDGRCEECGQAMHIRTAQFVKRDWNVFGDRDNIKLLCYCCKNGRKNMLLNPNLIILDRNMDYLTERLGFESKDQTISFLRENLKYAVHTNTFNPNKQKNRTQVKDKKIRGQYWLPGIGRCRLQVRYQDGKREYTLEFTECAKDPKLIIKPQERSRNLLI
ncbi:hypothetical protein [Bacillus sp. FSL K6-6540]|uniref:hypothetical protein n=1 Tax=Bacillus sp. FSL K6-6540 TaxID=2921512 RepID=UPI0030F6CB58